MRPGYGSRTWKDLSAGTRASTSGVTYVDASATKLMTLGDTNPSMHISDDRIYYHDFSHLVSFKNKQLIWLMAPIDYAQGVASTSVLQATDALRIAGIDTL